MSIKYQIIKCDVNLNCTVLATHWEHPMAIEYLNKHVTEAYQLGSTYKCYHESENVLTIYKYNYVYPKELVAKFHIIQFEDVPEE